MEQHAIHQSFVIIDLRAKVLQLKPTWLLFPSRKVPGCRTDRLFCQPDFGSHSPRWTDWSQAGLGHQTGGITHTNCSVHGYLNFHRVERASGSLDVSIHTTTLSHYFYYHYDYYDHKQFNFHTILQNPLYSFNAPIQPVSALFQV